MGKTKYLIIGNSAGGIGAAEAIRQRDSSGSITIVSDEPYHVYGRALISKYLSGERTFEDMLYRHAGFYKQNNIDFIRQTAVTGLDLSNRSATLENGESIKWQKILLATGGTPIVPPIEGIDKNGVFTFTRLDDAKVLDQYLYNAGKAVVIGGGLIGVSVSEALSKRGIEVTMVEMKENILNVMLDETASRIARQWLESAGIKIITGQTVDKIGGAGSVKEATLSDGRSIPCDLVVAAIGVIPRTGLASKSGIDVNRGILVDRRMQTSEPDVYACGDAAEAWDFVLEQRRSVPIWPGAYIGGRTAGINMSGGDAEYPGVTSMNSLNYFGLDIVSAGMVTPVDEGCEVLTAHDGEDYKKLIICDGMIKGFTFVGDIDKAGIVFGLMKDGIEVNNCKSRLLAKDLGLIDLPQELWRQRLECSI